MNYEEFFKGKKITLLGLGLLGRGVGDAEFLAQMGAAVLVTDKKTEQQLEESVKKLKKYPSISFFLGGHRMEDFTMCDMVIKAAGVSLLSPEIQAAREAGVPVYMSTALFAKFAGGTGATIVGVTGTRGKSTVTNMIYHSLKNASKTALLGGNVRGVSTLALLPQVKKDTICVLELDSWQLQGFGDLQISPHVAVFTNLKLDHLNYYPDMQTYFDDKVNICKFQKQGDVLIVGQQVHDMWIRDAHPPISPVVPEKFSGELKLIGEHNRENASLAAEALRAIGLSAEEIDAGITSFEAVEGRLQLVRKVNGVKIYNDNNATTPDATIVALAALATEDHSGKIVLIMGGADKRLDMEMLVKVINEKSYISAIVLLPGTGTDKIASSLESNSFQARSMNEAVQMAFNYAKSIQGVVLFSPAFASFGLFKNEYDRNDQFVAAVRAIA